jgi:endonuclease/exonuclease/phosphatase family metal-dependent hydrolase
VEILSWNLKYPGRNAAKKRVAYLGDREWDVLTLQEVSPRAREALRASELAEDAAFGLDLLGEPILGWRHGAAVLTRNGYRIRSATLLSGIPKPERGVSAAVAGPDQADTVRVVSWHAPNASGEGVRVKMHGYRGLLEHIGPISEPLILGFDSNHWNRSTELEPAPPGPEHNAHYLENLFFSNAPPHRLRDAYLVFLAERPSLYAEVLRRSPEGPLATSYVRGKTADRFDYIFCSPEFRVDFCGYDFEFAVQAGSDHGSVHASVTRRPGPGEA